MRLSIESDLHACFCESLAQLRKMVTLEYLGKKIGFLLP